VSIAQQPLSFIPAIHQIIPREYWLVRKAGGPRPIVQLPVQRLKRNRVVVLVECLDTLRARGGTPATFFVAVFDFSTLGGNGSTHGQNFAPFGLVGTELEESGPD